MCENREEKCCGLQVVDYLCGVKNGYSDECLIV